MKASTMTPFLLGLMALLCALTPSGTSGQGLSPPPGPTETRVTREYLESASPSPSLVIPAADWPQLQRDPQHTGTSP